ncbi:MAG TPA: glycosyltransferase family 4 protein [Acidimicrobiales bacterium]|nr:glycosyltransferase family 4 protein [Acidimicrobiales bacterium]
MRVVHVSPTVFGAGGVFGGGERYPLELASALSRHVECRLVTFGPPSSTNHSGAVPVRVLKPLAHLWGHPAHPVSTALLRALEGADIVHTHHLRSTPSRLSAVVSILRRRRLVNTDHGLEGGDWHGLLTHLFDRLLTVSRYSAERLGAAPSRTRVIYGGVDVERFAPQPDADRRGVLFVGRLTPHKGVDRLIQALPEGTPLVIVGSGGHDRLLPERDYVGLLHRLAEGRAVRFAGAVSDTELAVLYRQAAVLALPSVEITCYGRRMATTELLGLSLLEAMASGTPVVASRLGGIPEVVEDGRSGYLVDPADPEDLRQRLAELIGNPRLARHMGDHAHDLVHERYTWEACARRCLDAYRELA